MTHTLRPAVRENAYVMLAVAGPTGSGKTYSALRLARGLAGPDGLVAVMDTEARRATHYTPPFTFHHMDLVAPFTPDNYITGIRECEKAGARVIVVDSMSHEWSGEGGLTDWHDDIVAERVERAMKRNPNGDEAGLVETFNVFGWREPKIAHKRMMAHLVQVRAHLVFALRAEERVKFVKERNEQTGRDATKIINAGWQPICEKTFMYEATTSFMLHPDKPGVPVPIKLQAQHAPFFSLTEPLTEAAGARLAAWAAGGAPPSSSNPAPRTTLAIVPPNSSPAAPPVAKPATPVAQEQPAPRAEKSFAGPDAPTFEPVEAIAMLTRMQGKRTTTARELAGLLEETFAPGVKTRQGLEMWRRSSGTEYRTAFLALHKRYVAYRDEHA